MHTDKSSTTASSTTSGCGGAGLVGLFACALSALSLLGIAICRRSTRGSASGGTTSRSAGPSVSSTSSGGSVSVTRGRLISAILLLFDIKWRTSINRFAEAMTLFAVICALLFPLLHTRAPLVRRLLADAVSVGAADLAAVRRARSPGTSSRSRPTSRLAAVLVPRPGPRPGGAARFVEEQDQADDLRPLRHGLAWVGGGIGPTTEWAYLLLAGLSTPLVLSVHTIVSRSTSPCRCFPAGTPRSSRRTSSPAPSSRDSRWS